MQSLHQARYYLCAAVYAQSNFHGYAGGFVLAGVISPLGALLLSYIPIRAFLSHPPVVVLSPTTPVRLQKRERRRDNAFVKNVSTTIEPSLLKTANLPTKKLLRRQNTLPGGLCLSGSPLHAMGCFFKNAKQVPE